MGHSNRIPKWMTNLTEDDVAELMSSDKEIMRQFARWVVEPNKIIALQHEITRLSQENLRLRTVMAAAHEEITEHWDARCDAAGYCPQSIVRHLRDGTGYYPEYMDKVVFSNLDEKKQVVNDDTSLKTNIPGLAGITEEPQEDGTSRFVFEIEDDKVDTFYEAFGLKTGDEEGFQCVVTEALRNMLDIEKSRLKKMTKLQTEEITTGEPSTR